MDQNIKSSGIIGDFCVSLHFLSFTNLLPHHVLQSESIIIKCNSQEWQEATAEDAESKRSAEMLQAFLWYRE